MTLNKAYQGLKRFTDNFNLYVRDAVNQSHVEIEDLQREQMLKGSDAFGQDIGKYSPLSVMLRKEKGLQTAFVDLKDTGDFQKAITVQANETEIDYYSKDWKQTELTDKYGERIFGIYNKTKLTEIIRPKLITALKNEMQ